MRFCRLLEIKPEIMHRPYPCVFSIIGNFILKIWEKPGHFAPGFFAKNTGTVNQQENY